MEGRFARNLTEGSLLKGLGGGMDGVAKTPNSLAAGGESKK